MRLLSRIFAATLCLCLFMPAAYGSDRMETIRDLLARQRSWILFIEYTDAAMPGERAQKLKFEYYMRDATLMGRWILESGSCDFEVTVREDGFSFPWCPPYNGQPSLDFDAADATYPFKSRNPRKLWLMAAL